MSKEWLNSGHLREYDRWTTQQLDQGAVTSPPKRDHRAFWLAVERKLENRPSKVTPIKRSQR